VPDLVTDFGSDLLSCQVQLLFI